MFVMATTGFKRGGGFYASDISDFSMNKYPDVYKARGPNGRVYELGAHIRRGIRNEERYTMRIAFAWDDAEARVVVVFLADSRVAGGGGRGNEAGWFSRGFAGRWRRGLGG